jgi:hypothetical protein
MQIKAGVNLSFSWEIAVQVNYCAFLQCSNIVDAFGGLLCY